MRKPRQLRCYFDLPMGVNMPTPEITTLTAADLDGLRGLIGEFVAAHPSLPFRQTYWDTLRPWLATKINDENTVQLVTRHDGELTGYALGLVQDTGPLIAPGTIGYVSLFVVSQSFRKAGIGSALWKALQASFLAKGITEVELFTAAANPTSNRFWEQHGFMPLMIKRRLTS